MSDEERRKTIAEQNRKALLIFILCVVLLIAAVVAYNKIDNYIFWNYSKCSYPDCSKLYKNGSSEFYYCKEHNELQLQRLKDGYCRRIDCDNEALSYGGLCQEHQDQVDKNEENLEKLKEWQEEQLKNRCKHDGCTNQREEGSLYCATHNCAYDGCKETPVTGTVWCSKHQPNYTPSRKTYTSTDFDDFYEDHYDDFDDADDAEYYFDEHYG